MTISSIFGKYIKSIVYGGLDGIITTFAVVSSVSGAALESKIVLILGFANLVADGFSMAVGDYLSTKAENAYSESRDEEVKESNNPVSNGVATFLAFAGFGFVPLITYIVAAFNSFIEQHVFFIASCLTGLTLLILGVLKSNVTNQKGFRAAIETLVVGGIAATVAYLIGYFISQIVTI